MWFRFLAISALNFAVTLASIFGLVLYILPEKTPLVLLNFANWVLAFLVTSLFSRWAFSKRLPTHQDSVLLVVFHLIVYLTGYLTYGLLLSDRGPLVVVSPEIVVQLVCEVAAIIVAAYHIRRRRLRSVLGEGMEI